MPERQLTMDELLIIIGELYVQKRLLEHQALTQSATPTPPTPPPNGQARVVIEPLEQPIEEAA